MLKKINTFTKLKRIITFIVLILCSYYLMNCVDEKTLSTNIQRIFIMLYFILIVFLIIKFNDYFCKRYIPDLIKKIILCASVFLTLIIICLGNSIIIPVKYDVNSIDIVALDEKNTNSQGYEVWLSTIELNHKQADFKNNVYNLFLWDYRDGALYSNGEQKNNLLQLSIPKGQEVTLSFAKHAWSGKVMIKTEEKEYVYDLFEPASDTLTIDIFPKILKRNDVENIILNIGAFLCLNLLFHLLGLTVYKKIIYSD